MAARGIVGAAMTWSFVAGMVPSAIGQTNPPPKPTTPATAPATSPPTSQATTPAAPDVAKLPAWVSVGQAAMRQRASVQSGPTVVIVTDATSYLAAIGAWRPTSQFPVLIDDGSPESREDIARFVRAYRPRSVVRWSSADAKGAGDESFGGWKPEAIFAPVAKAWEAGDSTNAGLIERFTALKHAPLGVVVTSEDDPAWPAAVALAAGRGQPMVFRKGKSVVDHALSPAEADEFCSWLESQLDAMKALWRGVGENGGIDAVALCSNMPAKIDAGKGASLATTDRVGRLGSGLTARERWAWTSQIFGGPSRATYQAMCGLFLEPHAAWIFDGYGDDRGFKAFDGTEASKAFDGAGVKIELFDAPRQGLQDWRMRAGRPLDADMVFVNTSGEPDRFGLRPGDARPGDIPMLRLPTMVYFVHSFSAAYPGNRDLIAGRWLERGAFLYSGSVHEPYLQAFVPTPLFVRRLRVGGPWAAIARLDDAPMWKIALFGDPLWAAGPSRPLGTQTLPLPDARTLTDELAKAAGERRIADVISILTLLGRDEEAAGAAKALVDSKPADLTPAIAAASIMPLFRQGDTKTLFIAGAGLDASRGANPMIRDALWLAAFPWLDSPDKANAPSIVSALRSRIRSLRPGRDAGELSRAMNLTIGGGDAVLSEARRALANPGQAAEFDRDAAGK